MAVTLKQFNLVIDGLKTCVSPNPQSNSQSFVAPPNSQTRDPIIFSPQIFY